MLPLDSKQELFAEPFVGAFEKSALGKDAKCDVQTFACFHALGKVTKCDVQTFACLGKVTKCDVQTFACLGKVTKCDVQTFSWLGKVTKCDVRTFACFQASAAVQMKFALFWAFYAAQNGIVCFGRFGTTCRIPVFEGRAVL